jgi:uncharacterized membrane protein YfcA
MPVLGMVVLVSLVAGYVRGYAGFGYSALAVSGLSVVVSPAEVVLAVFSLEVLVALAWVRGSLSHINPLWLKPLLLGNLVFVPVGIVMLSILPQELLRLVLGGALLLCALWLRAVDHAQLRSSIGLQTTAGIGSGLLNGLAASGGLWAAMLMAASGMASASLRATMNMLLLIAGLYAMLCAALMSTLDGRTLLLSTTTLWWIALLLPPMWLGVRWGQRRYAHSQAVHFRRQVLNLLMVISTLVLLRAAWDLHS